MSAIGFKVVNGKKVFRPATDLALQRVRYRIGQVTTQDECGPFALFSSLEQSRDFAARQDLSTILLCEYEPSDEDTLWKKGKPDFVRSRYGRGHGYLEPLWVPH